MKIPVRFVAPLLGSIAALLPVRAAEIQKANNTAPLNTGASWVGGVVPSSQDIALWDNTLTVANTSGLGGSLSLAGIRVTNPAGSIIAGHTAGATLTLGTAGIDMSTATAAFSYQGAFSLSGGQTWAVANANTGTSAFGFNGGEDLAFNAGITTVSEFPFNLQDHVVTTTGAGTVIITSGYAITDGSISIGNARFIIQGGASKLTSIRDDVLLSVAAGSILHLQSNSGAMSSAAIVNLNGGTLQFTTNNATLAVTQSGPVNVMAPSTLLAANTVTNGGPAAGTAGPLILSGNLIGPAPLAINNTTTDAARLLRLQGDNSGYSGTLTFGGTAGRFTRLTSASAGSAAATWNIGAGHSLQVDGLSVSLGTLAGTGTVTNSSTLATANIDVGAGTFAGSIADGAQPISLTKVSPGTLLLTGVNTYTGLTTVNEGSLLAAPGSLGMTSVNVSGNAAFGVRLLAAGTTLSVPALTVGSGGGATVEFDLGIFGNTTVPAMNVDALNIAAPSRFRVTGTNFSIGTFPLLDYSGAIGGLGAGGITLVLPPRVIGSLANDTTNTSFSVTISGFDAPKWTAAVDGKWDIDNGTGTGTANWREINSGAATRYIQSANGSDTVRFDDSAVGTTVVDLTTTLLPTGIVVDNTTRAYAFGGAGRISGTGGLIKRGTGILRIRNAGVNDYVGATDIEAGTIELGDGVTAGAGTLGQGPITNGGTLLFNRPDNFTVAPAISGAGGLGNNGAGTVTLAGAVLQAGPVVLNGGGLVFGGGGTLSGAITGTGALSTTAGTLELTGDTANTFTGLTTISGGTLRLSKAPGVNAVGGNVTITGPGLLTMIGNEQIPDTATITFNGTSADSTIGSTGTETVANVIVNASVATGQFIIRNNFTITDTATVQNGILSLASNHTANINRINISGGIVRIAGSGGPSTMNVGAGGILASGGVFEVKFNTNDQDAILNLGGDVTATGNLTFNNANYAGPNQSRINLTGTRTFNIAAGTTTTVRPEVSGPGGLVKTGAGLLDLLGRLIDYAGDTVVSGGTLRTAVGAQSTAANITVADAATLALRIPVAGSTLTTQTVTLGSANGATLSFDLADQGNPTVAPLVTSTITANGTNTLAIIGATTPGSFPLIDYNGTFGGGGFGALRLQLPLRVAGNLVNNTTDGRVDVNIIGTDTLKWNGLPNGNWDVDDGTGTGTPNWRGSLSGSPLRYLQGPAGTDAAVFDDTAAGTTDVVLTTTLTPIAVTVDNSARAYSFSGAGKISGTTGITKSGAGTLTIRNTGVNDYSGATLITAGTLQIGDGVTAGAGSLGLAAVTTDATLALNRPDETFVTNAINGSGGVTKIGPGITTLAGALTYTGTTAANAGTLVLNSPSTLNGPVAIAAGATLRLDHGTGTIASDIANAGTLNLNGTASLNAIIGGTGGLTVNTAGAKTIGGSSPNTFTGLTMVTAGNLALRKDSGGVGAVAIGGDLLIDGGIVTVGALGDQFADTSSITVQNGQLVSTFAGGINKDDTIANLTINAATPVSTFNGFNITGTLRITAGVQHDAVNSLGTTSANRVVLSNTNIRLGANSGPSTLNIGSGGVSLTDASIVYGSAGNSGQLATVTLGGNVTASGFSAFDVNSGNPMSRLDLGTGTRTFNILDGITTVEPSIISATPSAGIVKTGPGTLILASGSNTNGTSTYPGDTLINAGTLVVNGSLTGTLKVDVSGTGTLSGSGTIAPSPGGAVNLLTGGRISPAQGPGILTVSLSGGVLDISAGVAPVNSQSLLFELDSPFSSDRLALNGGPLNIGAGVLEFDDFGFTTLGFFEPGGIYTLFEGDTPIVGTFGPRSRGVLSGQEFGLQLADSGTDLVLVPVPEPGSAALMIATIGLSLGLRRRRACSAS